MAAQGRLLHSKWDLYDTRHVVYRPARFTPETLEAGYWRAYRDFYRWGAIAHGAWTHDHWGERLHHLAYAGGWKRCEPMWDLIIRAKRASSMLPVLETVLAAFGARRPARGSHGEHRWEGATGPEPGVDFTVPMPAGEGRAVTPPR